MLVSARDFVAVCLFLCVALWACDTALAAGPCELPRTNIHHVTDFAQELPGCAHVPKGDWIFGSYSNKSLILQTIESTGYTPFCLVDIVNGFRMKAYEDAKVYTDFSVELSKRVPTLKWNDFLSVPSHVQRWISVAVADPGASLKTVWENIESIPSEMIEWAQDKQREASCRGGLQASKVWCTAAGAAIVELYGGARKKAGQIVSEVAEKELSPISIMRDKILKKFGKEAIVTEPVRYNSSDTLFKYQILAKFKDSDQAFAHMNIRVEDGILQLDSINVNEDFRRMKVGWALFEKALATVPGATMVKSTDFQEVNKQFVDEALAAGKSVEEAIKNAPSYQMFERFGFSEIVPGSIKSYVNDDGTLSYEAWFRKPVPSN
ncbi:MAG: hypothetical protein AB7G93_03460 [Bdellovibrionales bacterium]